MVEPIPWNTSDWRLRDLRGETAIHIDNHYVPRLYLKRWSTDSNKVWTYRLLASHENVPLWRPQSFASLASHQHLYTRHFAGAQADEIENWLALEFEEPAERSIEKIIVGARMHPEDWRHLARFVAAQDVRTPASMIERITRWQKTLPEIVKSTLRGSVLKLQEAKEEGRTLQLNSHPFAHEFPSRVSTEIEPGAETGTLRLETAPGRALWLFTIRHALTSTVSALLKHRWVVLRPPRGVRWLTSDNPVIRLNYHAPGRYDFGGGWGSVGSEILLPLSPDHLIYTKIGSKPQHERTSDDQGRLIQRLVIEHAHRFVFAVEPNEMVQSVRPRCVDASAFKAEAAFWERWHKEQADVERDLWARAQTRGPG